MQATGVLYQPLWEAIQQIAWPSNVTKQKAIAFVESLLRKRHMENTEPLEFTDMARNYFAIKLGEKYRSITRPLLHSGILQSSNYYRPGYYTEDGEYIKGQCLSYRINPELLDDEIIKINYKGEKARQRCRDEVTMTSKRIMRQIRIPDLNSRELINFVKKSLSDARIRATLRVNDEIRDSKVFIKGHSHPIPIEQVRRRTKDLIKDGRYCHIDHLEDYIKRKRRHLTQAYCDQLLRLKHRNVYADRNETNLRLDSNLTNLKSEFMSLLSIDGQRLSQVDLKNSQFRIFVYLLEQVEREILFLGGKTEKYLTEENLAPDRKMEVKVKRKKIEGKPVTLLCVLFNKYGVSWQGAMPHVARDYKEFKTLVKTGQLYEHIQKLIWRETGNSISRKEAKKIMFTLAFASHRYQSEEKQILKKYFPSVVAVIDGFKKAAIAEERGPSIVDGSSNVSSNPEDGTTLSSEEFHPLTPPQGGHPSRKATSAEARKRGNAAFAILLQQTESLIFIDEILSQCHKAGIKALSKHDSIVCRQCDKHKVTKVICKVLNELFGRYTYALDIDGELFDLKPKKKSRVGRVATTLLYNLFSGVNGMANGPPVTSAPLSNLSGNIGLKLQTSGSLDRDKLNSKNKELLGNPQRALAEFKRKLEERRLKSRDRSRWRDRW